MSCEKICSEIDFLMNLSRHVDILYRLLQRKVKKKKKDSLKFLLNI